MKKLTALLLVLLLLLPGCSQKEPEPETEGNDLTVVGIIQVGAESDWRIANTESMKQQFTERNGYRLLFEDARQKQENQVMALRKFIQQKVDYIILMPIEENGWTSVLQDAKDAGIPVILVDRMVNVEDDSLYTAHVGSNFYLQGRMAVRWIEREFRNAETVNIVHIQGTPESTAQIGRTRALEEAAEEQESWNILVQLDGDYTQPKAYSVMNGYLNTLEPGTEIDVVYCENDNEAFGAIEALEEHGYVCGRDVQIVSFDATRQCLEMVMAGKIAMAVECNPLLGPMAEEIVKNMEAGQLPEKQQFVRERSFTRKDVTRELIDSRGY